MEGAPQRLDASDEELRRQIAHDLHEAWRDARRQNDGMVEPRVKRTTDESWLRTHGVEASEGEVDIAGVSFEELPRDWQHMNEEAVDEALAVVRGGLAAGLDPDSEHDLDLLAARIHELWLSHHADAPDSQRVAFHELQDADKEADRRHVRAAWRVLRSH